MAPGGVEADAAYSRPPAGVLAFSISVIICPRRHTRTVPSDCVADLDAADGAFARKQMSEVLGVKVA